MTNPSLKDKLRLLRESRQQQTHTHDDARPIEEREPPIDLVNEHRRQSSRPQIPKPNQPTIGSLPSAPDAEKGLLSSILHDPQILNRTIDTIGGSSAFYDYPTRTILEAVIDLQENSTQSKIDFITLAQNLEDRGLLETAGGPANISEMFTFVPTSGNASYYTEIVKEKADLRNLIQNCRKHIDQALVAQTPDQSAELFDEVEQSFKAITQTRRNGYLPAMDDLSSLTGANRPEPPPELVKGILHQGSKLILGGTSKGRKTFSLLDLAVSVSTGTPWWGLETIQGPVCYINFEIQLPFFAKRFEDICRAKDATPAKGMFMGWTLRGMVEGIEKMSDSMIKSLQDHKFALIVIDPIYKALGDRDENKAGDVASMLNELERIAVKTGAAIAFGAHYSKGNQAAKESMDRIGGSGVFARDPDSILTMTPHEQDDHFIVNATLRNFAPTDPFVVRWEWPLFHPEPLASADDIKMPKNNRAKANSDNAKYSSQDLIDVIKSDNNGKRTTEIQRFVCAETGMSKDTFYRFWKPLTKNGTVVKRQDGRWIAV